MKTSFKFILLGLIFALFAVSGYSQNSGYMLDTIQTSSSSDTVIMYPGGTSGSHGAASLSASKTFSGGILNVYVETDSLSGTAQSVLKLQYGYGTSPVVWYDKTTTILNGASVQPILTTDATFGANKWRLYGYSRASNGNAGSSTQKIRIKANWALTPR